ncbi:proline-rich nuclear receptor coactivator motif-containing protein [Sporobolomyces koalae]|uniref:proline-rich nuclear receptor coactivator motif-containing protein n=1 Tax=Sporobolomyces koalae TaxID=500713 RepID=UPI003173CED4
MPSRSQPLLSPTSPARQSPQRSMPSRTQPQYHRQLSNVPGIINLPPSGKGGETHSSMASSYSPRQSRHSATKLVHQSLGEKPVPTLDHSLLGQSLEPKKRRRQKKAQASTATEDAEDSPVALVDNGITSSAPHDDASVGSASPSKARRSRRGRGSRQTSPPLPDALLGVSPPASAASAFTSTTPPQAEPYALHAHSHSVPPELPQHHRSHHRAEMDAWDMPVLAGGAGAHRTSEPKENLSWQQELLKSAPVNTVSRRGNKVSDSPGSRAGPRNPARQSAPTSRQHNARPPLNTSASDTSMSTTNPSLNWQQEMLLQTDLQTSALTDRRANSSSPIKSSTAYVHGQSHQNVTPARQRQQRIKDSITFGLTDLHLSEADDYSAKEDPNFASPVSRHNSTSSRRTPRRVSPPAVAAELVTPTKQQDQLSLGPRYAGPTFHNSPAPSSLPVPSFVLRRQT